MADRSIDLTEISSRLGLPGIPEALEAAATPIRRGHHLAMLAAEGSGKASVYGLAVLENCDSETEELQALVLVPEAGYAWRTAAAIQRVVGSEGFLVACPSAAPSEERTAEPPRAGSSHVLVGRPSRLLPEIRTGHRSISALRLLVLDRVTDLRALDEWSSVEPILETLPKECRRIAVADRADAAFEELIERQLPRARRWPEDLLPAAAPEAGGEGEAPAAALRCAIVPAAEFGEAFERCVRDADGLGAARVDFVFATAEEAARGAAQLAVAGLRAELSEDGSGFGLELPGEGAAAVAHVGLPLRLEPLAEALAGEGPRYAVVEPRHAAQMALYARRVGREMRPLRGRILREELDPVLRYRMRLREAAESADLMSELLILEPLFEELGPVRVAAVLSELLRRRGDETAFVRPWADVEMASSAAAARPGGPARRRQAEEVPRGVRPAWTRLYFGVGRRDEAKPGDLVGAITGETGIAGAQIGKIEIMGNFSLVDVDSQVADEVMRKLEGVQIRGRAVPVRRDRET